MRLFRLGNEVTKVAADVRAALVSWGRGGEVLGGVALLGCRPPECPRAVDAILVLPRGVLVVAGVDLPDPTMRLDAPVNEQWKTDGWPLVRGDGTVNPGMEALESASAIAGRLQSAGPEPMPVGIVIAVGPYVGKVVQPTTDLARGIRILHPEPSTLLSAARELAVYDRRCTVDKARGILAALAPNDDEVSDMQAAEMLEEGFSERATPDMVSTAVIARITDVPAAARQAAASGRRKLRWLPVSAAILVGLLLVSGIVSAIVSTGDDRDSSDHTVAEAQQSGIVAGRNTFVPKGSSADGACADRAYGDIGVSLAAHECARLVRARFESNQEKGRTAVLVADLAFADPGVAAAFAKVAETPGSGGISDASSAGVSWPDGRRPFFESSAYTIRLTGPDVRIVQVVWMDKPSAPDDPDLKVIAQDALELPK